MLVSREPPSCRCPVQLASCVLSPVTRRTGLTLSDEQRPTEDATWCQSSLARPRMMVKFCENHFGNCLPFVRRNHLQIGGFATQSSVIFRRPDSTGRSLRCGPHWSPTVPVSVWLPEPARDRGSKQKTLNDDCYHTTCRSAAIFGVQTVLSYLVLTLNLWIGLCPMKRSSGVWSFDEVSVTYRRSSGYHTLAGAYVPVTYYRNRLLVSQQSRCFTGHNLILFQCVSLHFDYV